MKKLMSLILLCSCLVGMLQADLAITNGDFEADASQTTNVTDWYDTTSTNWWEAAWAGPNVSPNGTPVLGLSYMNTTTNWAYQSLGSNDANWEGMEVTYDVGSFTDAGEARDLGVTISVYESDGSFTPADDTDIDGAAGMTLIDSVSTLHEAVTVGAVVADQTVTLDLRSSGSGELFLRFVNYIGVVGEPWTAIDNIVIAPVVFSFDYDSPAGGAVQIPTERTASENDLVFTINDADITEVDVQFGVQDDPNLTEIASYKIVDGLSVTPGQYTIDLESELTTDLEYETIYYWKVIGYEPNMLPGATDFFPIPGPVSSFTTTPESPSITTDYPAYQAVDAGQDAVLSVTGVAVDSYQWYKIGDPDILLADGVDYSGVTTNTLTILGVELADEGYYYCEGSKTGFDSDASVPGRVMTHRLTSYYPFETTSVVDSNTITPDVVGGFDAMFMQESASAGMPVLDDANQLDASLGYYLKLDNADHATDPNGQFAQIPAGVVDYENLTISVWIHSKSVGQYARIFDFGNDTTTYMMLTPDVGAYDMRFDMTTGTAQQLLGDFDASNWTAPGSWYHVVVTLSGDTGRLYRNGELVATNTGMTLNPIDLGTTLNYIGKSQWPQDPEFDGLIDELKIYNYARTTEQIAQDYLGLQGEWVCNNETYDLAYDFDGNCQVDLADFALFAATWLDTYRIYPQ